MEGSLLFSSPTDRLSAFGFFSSERIQAWGELDCAREGAEPQIDAFRRFSQISDGVARFSRQENF